MVLVLIFQHIVRVFINFVISIVFGRNLYVLREEKKKKEKRFCDLTFLSFFLQPRHILNIPDLISTWQLHLTFSSSFCSRSLSVSHPLVRFSWLFVE